LQPVCQLMWCLVLGWGFWLSLCLDSTIAAFIHVLLSCVTLTSVLSEISWICRCGLKSWSDWTAVGRNEAGYHGSKFVTADILHWCDTLHLLPLLWFNFSKTNLFCLKLGGCQWTKNSACYGHVVCKGIPRTLNRILWILLFTRYFHRADCLVFIQIIALQWCWKRMIESSRICGLTEGPAKQWDKLVGEPPGESVNTKPLLYAVAPPGESVYNLIINLGANFGELEVNRSQRLTFDRHPNGVSSPQKSPNFMKDKKEEAFFCFSGQTDSHQWE